MENELVSVYIPTHNRCHMLKRAVESVLSQTYKNIEIIVSDDGSTDATEEYITELSKKNLNVFYIKSNIPQGACAARNKAIFVAKGMFITGLDDDDEFTPDRIERLVTIYKKYEKYSFISTGVKILNKKSVSAGYTKAGVITSEMLFNENVIGNQVLTKTEFMTSIGGFDEELPAWQDYECWIRLSLAFGQGYNSGELTYIMHLEHDLPRVSRSNNAKKALEIILGKYQEMLTSSNIKNLKVNYLYNYVKVITVKELFLNLTILNLVRYGKLLIRRFIKN
ncbi:glycosyltransferase [Kosakonia oryzae]|uniref:Glycosyltransferase n=1 Tax=Kosakonia oryzae TaxID=497725 RepID=A0AA94H458_9ENTR|nr:glycosyltransferase [Kosakonia oryzae]ANI82286.1 glycosyltransferase [Kosakonia oryzae]SFC53370.1 Glycosyltransferase involved in cell wall bisynthesis [Kosakonia oryzae]